MIAKGLDFPNVTLVGVVDADTGLHLPDFRARERTFQLLSQVAGRAGRAARAGEVLIQTRAPEDEAVRRAVEHDFIGFAAGELEARREPHYPPLVRLARIEVSGEDAEVVEALALGARDWLDTAVGADETIERLGPAPCAIRRVQTRWRWHLLLRTGDPGALTRLLTRFVRTFEVRGAGEPRVSVDRDPTSLL
jgi:primosomal protein N' (replication factor Y)